MGDGVEVRKAVLVVDDDEDLRGAVEAALDLYGYPVVAMADARRALDYLRNSAAPGLILMDLLMPAMDARQFRELQRQDPRLAKIPLVILTGVGAARASALLDDATPVVRKPVSLDEILQVVRRYYR